VDVPPPAEQLRQIARRHLRRERPDHSLQATALVNEAYLRLVDVTRLDYHDRTHFFAMAARVMRRILVDHARAVGRGSKRGDVMRSFFEVRTSKFKLRSLTFRP
jgi:RNA polymerase sigma factor (TIGR02999 family)